MNRCRKCIMPSDFPDISFDSDQVCNLCNDYSSYHLNRGPEELLNEIETNKNDSKYDCIVPISGGKDSTSILYYVVRTLKLKPLAVNYNSGYQNRIALENIENACKTLNVDLVLEKGKYSSKLIRQLLLVAIRDSSIPMTGKFCKNCETMLRFVSIKNARKFNVNSIIWGSSALESGTNNQYIQYINTYKNENSLKEKFITLKKLKKLFTTKNIISKIIKRINKKVFGWHIGLRAIPNAIMFNIYSILQRYEMGLPFRYLIRPSAVLPFTADNPRFLHYYDYIEWDSMDMVKLLKKELLWNHPEGKEDRFDCAYHILPNYFAYKQKKITADGINYCNFVRENKLSRDEALEKERKLESVLEHECQKFYRDLGLIHNYGIQN